MIEVKDNNDFGELWFLNNIIESKGYGRGMRYYLPSDGNGATSKKHRFSCEKLSTMIVKICSDWVTMEEIEVKTGKSNSYLRNSVIKRMQNERKLGMLYPNARNHPKRNRK